MDENPGARHRLVLARGGEAVQKLKSVAAALGLKMDKPHLFKEISEGSAVASWKLLLRSAPQYRYIHKFLRNHRIITYCEEKWLPMQIGRSVPKASVLTSWKDIARYMGKGVRTVQRWEQDFGLPVRRSVDSRKKAVLARPSDLDSWVALRCLSRAELRASGEEVRFSSLALPTAVRTQMETSRILRRSNREVLRDIRLVLNSLREQIRLMCDSRQDLGPREVQEQNSSLEAIPAADIAGDRNLDSARVRPKVLRTPRKAA